MSLLYMDSFQFAREVAAAIARFDPDAAGPAAQVAHLVVPTAYLDAAGLAEAAASAGAAWVGLTNERLGNVQLGHQADFMFDYLGRLSNGFQLTNFYLFHPGNFDNLANQFQIDNAVRYSEPDQPIDLVIDTETNALGAAGTTITVRNKPGVASWPDGDKIFQKYYRSTGAKSISGTGLGLFLVRNICTLLGGTCRYEPTDTHVSFKVWLPN